MEIKQSPIPDLKIVTLKRHGDARGFFMERFNEVVFATMGLPIHYAQDNHSRSAPGVIRGLHFQHTPPQGKLVGCLAGRIWDVAVDVRPNSPTYGKYFGLELSDENATLLWIPAGFAHGFAVLGNQPADVLYKVTAIYHAAGERGLRWNDPELAIAWPRNQMVSGDPIISQRDTALPSFAEYKKDPVSW